MKMETNIPNLQVAAKAVLRRFTVINAYFKKTERSQINNLTLYLKELEKEEQTKPKLSRRKEIIKIRIQINKIDIRKRIYYIRIYMCVCVCVYICNMFN